MDSAATLLRLDGAKLLRVMESSYLHYMASHVVWKFWGATSFSQAKDRI